MSTKAVKQAKRMIEEIESLKRARDFFAGLYMLKVIDNNLLVAINTAKSAGYDVYLHVSTKRLPAWFHFTDGTRIGYCQYVPSEGYSLSSIHIPNQHTGNGYSVARHVARVDASLLAEALNLVCPGWDMKNMEHVNKYRDIDHWLEDEWFKQSVKI